MFRPLSLTAIPLALGWSAPAAAHFQYHLPDSYFLPSAASFEMTNNMGERHGGSTLQWSSASLTIPFANPRRSGWDDWYFNAALNFRITELSASGSLLLDRQTLYDIALPISLIHPLPKDQRLIVSVAPHVATDFGGYQRSLNMNGFVDYRFLTRQDKNTQEKTLTCSLGLAYLPNAAASPVLPFLTCDWKPSGFDWTFSLRGWEAKAMWNGGNLPAMGFFVKAIGGAWATHMEEGTRLLRVQGLAVGTRMEENFAREGQTKRIWYVELGTHLFTTAKKIDFSDMDETLEMHHYHPGLYISGGVDFRF